MNEANLVLQDKPTLADYRAYLKVMRESRGFGNESLAQLFQLLMEECGELAKAARKTQGIKIDPNSKTYDVGEEAADVFIYLMALCDRMGIDLEDAFRKKEEKNKLRTWS